MLYRVLIILLLISKCTTANAIEDYSFLNGEWFCKMKSVLPDDAILEVDSHVTTSIKDLNSYSKSFFKFYFKQNPDLVSVISVESSEKMDFEGDIMISSNSKTHKTNLIKDNLNLFSPESVKSFTRGPSVTVKSKIKKIDDETIKLIGIPDKDIINCSKTQKSAV
ncbi:hypothetical protein [Pseudoalteromonas gelatinilytica]